MMGLSDLMFTGPQQMVLYIYIYIYISINQHRIELNSYGWLANWITYSWAHPETGQMSGCHHHPSAGSLVIWPSPFPSARLKTWNETHGAVFRFFPFFLLMSPWNRAGKMKVVHYRPYWKQTRDDRCLWAWPCAIVGLLYFQVCPIWRFSVVVVVRTVVVGPVVELVTWLLSLFFALL